MSLVPLEDVALGTRYQRVVQIEVGRLAPFPAWKRAMDVFGALVLLLIGISAAFGYFMALYEVPQKTGELMTMVSKEPWVIFLMINVLLFILGTFLDMAATILICTPIFLPIAMQFGMDPLQFGTATERNYVWYSIVGLVGNPGAEAGSTTRTKRPGLRTVLPATRVSVRNPRAERCGSRRMSIGSFAGVALMPRRRAAR